MEDNQARRQVRASAIRGNKYSGAVDEMVPTPRPPQRQPFRPKDELWTILRSIPIWTALLFLVSVEIFLLIIATCLLIAKGW